MLNGFHASWNEKNNLHLLIAKQKECAHITEVEEDSNGK
jgi:hypothetical protein